VKPQRDPRLNLTGQGYCVHPLAGEETTAQNSKQTLHRPGRFDDYRIRTSSFRHSGATRRLFVFLGSWALKRTTWRWSPSRLTQKA